MIKVRNAQGAWVAIADPTARTGWGLDDFIAGVDKLTLYKCHVVPDPCLRRNVVSVLSPSLHRAYLRLLSDSMEAISYAPRAAEAQEYP